MVISRTEKQKELEEQLEKEKKQEKIHDRIRIFLKIFFSFLLLFFLLLLFMHFIGTKGLVVREYKIESTNLPENFHGFKIVHFSDLHYLSTVSKKEMERIVTKINQLKPDIVVFTGDLMDSRKTPSQEDFNDLIEQLQKIEATTGYYAIKGNHDYENDYFNRVFQETKFKILNNSYELIYSKGSTPILLTGVGSILANDCEIDQAFRYSGMDSLFTITLLHEPDIIDSITKKYQVDLALAGHSHNGQIRLPRIGAIFKVKGGEKYPNESYLLENTSLYVSGGLGTSIYQFRLFNKPSINLYRLVQK